MNHTHGPARWPYPDRHSCHFPDALDHGRAVCFADGAVMSEPTSSATMTTLEAMDAVEAVEEAPPPGPNATPSAASSLLVLPIGGASYEDSVRALVFLPRGIPVTVRIVKRAVDVVTAIVGLSIVAVLLPFLALAI